MIMAGGRVAVGRVVRRAVRPGLPCAVRES
jgi:hypothetical protein